MGTCMDYPFDAGGSTTRIAASTERQNYLK